MKAPKRLLLALVALMVVFALTATVSHAEHIKLPANGHRVTEALIYQVGSKAQITRRYELKLNLTERNTLELPDFPMAMEDDSLELAAIDLRNQTVSISSTVIHQILSYPRKSREFIAAAQSLRKDIYALDSRISTVNQLISRLENKIQLVYQLANNSISGQQLEFDKNLLTTISEYLDSDVSALQDQIVSANAQKSDLTIERELKRNQLDSLVNRGILIRDSDYSTEAYWPEEKRSKVIELTTVADPSAAKSATESLFALEVTYLTHTANWNPSYDLRFTSAGSRDRRYHLGLQCFASVSQSTGDDWIGTKLSLSTASANFSPQAPEPSKRSIYYRERQPMAFSAQYEGLGSAQRSGMLSKAGSVRLAEADTSFIEPVAMQFTAAGAISSSDNLAQAYKFTILDPVDIPSFDESYKYKSSQGLSSSAVSLNTRFFIDALSMDASLFSFIVPSSGKTAYLRAFAHHDADAKFPILPSSSTRVFLEDSYMGNTFVPETMPGGTILLNLGIDKNVIVRVNKADSVKGKDEKDMGNWFVSDKKRFRLSTEEQNYEIMSTYSTGATLLIMSENLPTVNYDQITLTLSQPAKADIQPLLELFDSKLDLSSVSDQAILQAMIQRSPLWLEQSAPLKIFHNPISGNLFWVKWLLPQETLRTTFKYQYSWPDDLCAECVRLE